MNFLNSLSGKKVLVTGATGFIGSHLCQHLLQYEAEVHGISRNPQPRNIDDVYWWSGDLVDFEFIQKVVVEVKPDTIFHLGSYVAGSRNLEAVLPTFHNNLTSTVNLLAAAKVVGCRRIILAGSMEEPEYEIDGAIPCSPYAASKFGASAYGRMFYALYKMPVVIARIFMVYGPRQKDLNKIIPYVILSLLRGEVPKLSSGLRPIDWIYVEDVVEGLTALALANGIDGATLDIGSGKLVTIREAIELLSRLVDPDIKPEFGALMDRPMEQVRTANTAETEAKIGWKAKTSLEKGFKQTIEWCLTLCRQSQ